MADDPIDAFEAEQKQVRAMIFDRAVQTGDPGWAIAWALLQVASQIEDVGEQLYQLAEIARVKGDG
jgi:hypothetical protein